MKRQFKHEFRSLCWRVLGFNYKTIVNKNDFTLLKDDKYSTYGLKTYDNGAKVWRWTKAPLIIGKYCSIANNVNFIIDEGFHSTSRITSYPLVNNLFKDHEYINSHLKNDFLKKIKQKKGITIGNDVRIGIGAYIMPGVTIGNGATIGANSVVTKNILDYQVVGGVPASVIKTKYDANAIEKLNEISWWNWEERIIKERVSDFNANIETFIGKYSK